MQFELDFRGVSCPVPFVQMKVHLKTLSEGSQLSILLGDQASLGDITRYLTNHQYCYEVLQQDGSFSSVLITGK